MHSYAILKDRVATLEEANRMLSKRRREKRKRVHHGGSIRIEDAQNSIDEDAETQALEETRALVVAALVRCGKPGHSARTCKNDGEISNVHNSHYIS